MITPCPRIPFDSIVIDICGPLIKSYKGNQYLLVIIDQFSHHSEYVPLVSIEPQRIARELIKFFARVNLIPATYHDLESNPIPKIMTQFAAYFEC